MGKDEAICRGGKSSGIYCCNRTEMEEDVLELENSITLGVPLPCCAVSYQIISYCMLLIRSFVTLQKLLSLQSALAIVVTIPIRLLLPIIAMIFLYCVRRYS